jgi:hypothetical protein
VKYDSYYNDLIEALAKIDVKQIIGAAAEPETFRDFSHKLLHYEVSAAFTAVGMNFASDFIFDELVNLWEQQGASDLEYFVMETSSSATMAGARGKAFEKVAHRYLEKVSTLSVDLFMKFQDYEAFYQNYSDVCWLQGGHFRIKDLSNGAISTLELPQMTCSVLSKKEDLVYKKNTYWKPKSRTYPAIDAFISLPSSINWDVCALQMTVSDNHGVIRHYVEDTL